MRWIQKTLKPPKKKKTKNKKNLTVQMMIAYMYDDDDDSIHRNADGNLHQLRRFLPKCKALHSKRTREIIIGQDITIMII